MTPPLSKYIGVEDIRNAGRGVIALQDLPTGTSLLTSNPPAAHVIIKQYRKEVCAYCFHYDRGRTLPVRDNTIGKVFCTQNCQTDWSSQQGELGIEAWRALHTFVQARRKAPGNDLLSFSGPKPGLDEIAAAWEAAGKEVTISRERSHRKSGKAQSRQHTSVDADHMGFFLSGILQHHKCQGQWTDAISSLAMDEQPYTSSGDLTTHCDSFIQLMSILPEPLASSDHSATCQTLVAAGGHNAFGIRSGGEDLEEYMGYAVYPSASYFNHSCRPNIDKKRVGRHWEFSTARDIPKGEECCITYLGGDERDLDLVSRRERLESVWGFRCMCVRCVEEQG